MAGNHLVLLVEEPSMEAFLRALLPPLLSPTDATFEVHSFQGKRDLLSKLESRLRAYARWLPVQYKLFVLVDRDDEDCVQLKRRMDAMAERVGLTTRNRTPGVSWQLVNRIVVEELEAWYFGDWDAVKAKYPRVSPNVPQRHGLRDSDAIVGGTWETFERIMQDHGYFKEGLAKIDAARSIAPYIDPDRNRSPSFNAFYTALVEALV